MSFKRDFDKYFANKTQAKRDYFPGTGNKRFNTYKPPRGKSKPVLFDEDAKSGPVKVYTREEIDAYIRERELEKKR